MALSFLPYGTIVDDFQRQVYENPDWTPEERKAAWRKLEAEFRPHITFDGIPYLEEGTRWQYQMHIYETPFYYIDYCLAQTAAGNSCWRAGRTTRTPSPATFASSPRVERRSLPTCWRRPASALPSRPGPCRPWPRRVRPCCGSWRPSWTSPEGKFLTETARESNGSLDFPALSC